MAEWDDGEDAEDALLMPKEGGFVELECGATDSGTGPSEAQMEGDGPRISRELRLKSTAGYFAAIAGLGFTMSAIGPTLPTLAEYHGLSSPTALAPLLIMRGVGYTVGTLGMGRIGSNYPHDRHKIVAVAAVAMGIFATLTPTFINIVALYIMVLMLSIFGGMVDLGCNVLLVDVWTGNEQGSAAMNLLHFMWGVGSFLAPLVAEGVGLEPSRLQATWTTIGVVSAALGVPIWFVPSPPTEDRSHEDDIADEKTIASDLSPPKVARMTRFSFGAAIVALSMYYFCYAGAEHALGDWLSTFAITTLHKSDDDGANLTSVYWGCLTLGRLLGAFTTQLLTASQLIAGDFTMASAGCVLLVTWGSNSLVGAYVGTAMLGIGLSTLYPMGIMLAEQKLKMTGGWISVFISGGTIGSVVLPLFVGLLMSIDRNALAWSTAVFVAIQLASYVYVARYKDRTTPEPAATIDPTLADEFDTGSEDSDAVDTEL